MMRYFVYFFNIPAEGHHQQGSAMITTADMQVPSWKKMRERLCEQFEEKGLNRSNVMITGFYEFENEQDCKDFCG